MEKSIHDKSAQSYSRISGMSKQGMIGKRLKDNKDKHSTSKNKAVKVLNISKTNLKKLGQKKKMGSILTHKENPLPTKVDGWIKQTPY